MVFLIFLIELYLSSIIIICVGLWGYCKIKDVNVFYMIKWKCENMDVFDCVVWLWLFDYILGINEDVDI